MEKVIQEILQFSKDRDWEQFHNEENLAKSIAIEAGELLECFQWSDNYDRQHVCEELADVMNYCILMADRLDVDIKDILMDKLEKNKIKYPVALSKGNAQKHTELKKAGK